MLATDAVRAPLSRERVVAAAMQLADGEGLSAITMRRLAADLGVEAMSLSSTGSPRPYSSRSTLRSRLGCGPTTTGPRHCAIVALPPAK
jgi:hypothetical protein